MQVNAPDQRHELVLPDLGLGQTPIVASVWLVDVGASVTAGDRLLEVVAGAVTVDLPSPASGVLTTVFVEEDEILAIGQVLAIVDAPPAQEST
ncbi:MAG TPA: lipoyl domain-containing protein [Pirellulales bacterium]|jgi:2-oxoglutarate dehydrogenase E2 component (dihydrolipoamide succinyltransferase)|nr:lipoyl domain-containing protein [Pirellulales bacterium]